ncbi:MAG TPA: hypothetical protein VGM54_17835 [Chthoniobacter sp.]|jgi:hypothetical protein
MSELFEIADGEVRIWLDQEIVMIKAVSSDRDPVELTKSQAITLAKQLLLLAERIDE